MSPPYCPSCATTGDCRTARLAQLPLRVRAGFVVAVVALSALSDRWSTAVIFVGSAFCAAVSTVAFGLFASGPVSAALLKAVGGIGIGGTYMPGVKLVSTGA